MTMSASELARTIDHALLAPETVPERIVALCDEAVRYGFGAVCVNPVYVGRAVERLAVARCDDAGGSG